jgi:para-nitrobenzyl esterase
MQRASFFSAAACAFASIGTVLAAIQEPVKLDSGQVSGIAGQSQDMRIFKGIPFAAAPVGNLRWRAPQPVPHWDGVRKAEESGPVCMQAGGGGQKVSEDCLYLNVWTSAKSASDKRPVMVFIYGGGNNTGSGSQPGYDGEGLAKKGPVIVTFNYRLGALGFLAHPELTKESDRRASGNYGLMDQIAALQWVQKNIAAFGGNPKNVTVFGESAGAIDIANLMTSPMAKGLFQKAIGESSGWGNPKKLAEAEQDGVKFAAALGATTLAEMRARPAETVLKAGRANNIVDGWLIPEDPGTVFAQGKQMDIPVLVGSNKDEGTFFITQPAPAAQFIQQSRAKYGDLADTFLKLYPANSEEQSAASQLASFANEMGFAMRNWAHLQSKTGKKAYFYYFTQEPPVQPNAKGGRNAGATHTAELPYVFQNLTGNRAWTETDRQLSDTMSSYWVNFAATGDPNEKGLPKWPAFDAVKSPSPLVLGPRVEVGPPPDQAKLAFFQSAYDKQRSR